MSTNIQRSDGAERTLTDGATHETAEDTLHGSPIPADLDQDSRVETIRTWVVNGIITTFLTTTTGLAAFSPEREPFEVPTEIVAKNTEPLPLNSAPVKPKPKAPKLHDNGL